MGSNILPPQLQLLIRDHGLSSVVAAVVTCPEIDGSMCELVRISVCAGMRRKEPM